MLRFSCIYSAYYTTWWYVGNWADNDTATWLMMSECPIWTWCCSLLPAPSSSAASASPTDSTAVTIPDPMALLASNLSESQTVIHHYVQRMGGFMWVIVYWCTSPHDSVMPSKPLCFMTRWKWVWLLALWSLRIHLWSLSCCVWLRNLFLTEFVSHYSR